MTQADTITYTCSECGYVNVWTRDEILRRGKKEVYRASESDVVQEDYYALPCKNPKIACRGLRTIAVEREEGE